MSGEQSVPKQIRDAIEASEHPELTVREVTQRTGLTEQQVYSAVGSMARLELDQRVGVVRLAEDDGGEFVDDRERELVTDGGVDQDEAEAAQSTTWMTPSGIRERMGCSPAMATRIEETFVTVEQLLDAIEDDEPLTSVDGVGPATAEVIEEWYENREEREQQAKTATVEPTPSTSLTIKNNGDWSDALGLDPTEAADGE